MYFDGINCPFSYFHSDFMFIFITFEIQTRKQYTIHVYTYTVKLVLSGHSKRTPKIGFQYQLLLNAGQKYCRMLQGEHSAILSTFIKLPFVFKTLVITIFVWPLKTGFTVQYIHFLVLEWA